MERQDIEHLERVLDLVNEMYFKDLQGKHLVDKMVILQNFAAVVRKLKTPPKLEPVKEKKSITKIGKDK